MLLTLLTIATDAALSPAGVYGTIGGAGAVNIGFLTFIYRAIAAERKERSDKIDQLYSHLNTHFARRETLEARLASLDRAISQQTEYLRAFIEAQSKLSQQQGRLEAKLETMIDKRSN